MSDYGEQAETAFRYFAIEGGSDPTPEPLTAEEIARTRADLARLLSGDAIPAGIAQRLLATLDAARARPGLDVERLGRALRVVMPVVRPTDRTAAMIAAEYEREGAGG